MINQKLASSYFLTDEKGIVHVVPYSKIRASELQAFMAVDSSVETKKIGELFEGSLSKPSVTNAVQLLSRFKANN